MPLISKFLVIGGCACRARLCLLAMTEFALLDGNGMIYYDVHLGGGANIWRLVHE